MSMYAYQWDQRIGNHTNKEKTGKSSQQLPELNCNRNRVHGIFMTSDKKSSKDYPFESIQKCIQVSNLEGQEKRNKVVNETERLMNEQNKHRKL